jgi:hypothetical protein
MPVNEVEYHPFLDYYTPLNENRESFGRYNRLIIGSFPVYSLTTSVGKEPRGCWDEGARFRFFYGSSSNLFWKHYLGVFGKADILKLEDPDQLAGDIKQTLEDNGYLITDVIRQTNRKGYSPLDSDLFCIPGTATEVLEHFQLNNDIINLLFGCENLKHLYFTALPNTGHTPWGWFLKLLKRNKVEYTVEDITSLTKKVSLFFDGNKKVFNFFFLFSPASMRGLHMSEHQRHPSFLRYLENNYPAVYADLPPITNVIRNTLKQQISQIRPIFLSDLYTQFFLNKNINYP